MNLTVETDKAKTIEALLRNGIISPNDARKMSGFVESVSPSSGNVVTIGNEVVYPNIADFDTYGTTYTIPYTTVPLGGTFVYPPPAVHPAPEPERPFDTEEWRRYIEELLRGKRDVMGQPTDKSPEPEPKQELELELFPLVAKRRIQLEEHGDTT